MEVYILKKIHQLLDEIDMWIFKLFNTKIYYVDIRIIL